VVGGGRHVLLPRLSLPHWRWSAMTNLGRGGIAAARAGAVRSGAELHLKFSTVAVACRKAMGQSGLATTDVIGHLVRTGSS
jgi:hypothetical protein